ncbi:MAG: aspartate aminotransferase family protein [bacterium]|nr:aspartate aminotransferase family protein [bacterium]
MADTKPHPIIADIIERFTERTGRSENHHARAKGCLPGGDTRSATYFTPYPVYMDSGSGCYLRDVDGNEYLDLLNNYTSLIHGHAHPAIIAATRAQLEKGTVFGAASEIQYRHAEHMCNRVPSLDRIRYCNSGTEATLFAIRAARAFTGKDAFIKIDGGYHGSHDAVEVNVFPDPDPEGPPSLVMGPGVPTSVRQDVLVVPFNDLDAIEKVLKDHIDKVAAILVEPFLGAGGAIPPQPGYLKGLRTLADKYEVVLIFDEVISFRLSTGGLQEIEGVKPDLTTLAKIIGGGLAIGAFGGRREIMSRFDPAHTETIFHSGTFNGNNITMAAGLTALELYNQKAADRLNRLGDELRHGFTAVLQEAGIKGYVAGYGSVMHLHWRDQPPTNATDSIVGQTNAGQLPAMVHLELLNRGVYVASRGMLVMSTPMISEDIQKAVQAFRDTLEVVKPYITDTLPHLLI